MLLGPKYLRDNMLLQVIATLAVHQEVAPHVTLHYTVQLKQVPYVVQCYRRCNILQLVHCQD